MKKLVLLFGLLLATAFCVQAQVDYFLKIDGIEGESVDKDHAKWIDIDGFEHGLSKPGSDGATGQSRRRGAAQFADLEIQKVLDKSSIKIQEALALGKVHPQVTLHVTKNRKVYYKYELTNVMVTSYSIQGSSGDVPTEEVTFNFEKIKVTYTEYDERGVKKGDVEYEWNIETGR